MIRVLRSIHTVALSTAALLLTATVAPAQLVTTVTGTVRAAGASACSPVATHGLDCAGIQLVSSVVDLNQFVGRNRKLTGEIDLSNPGCPTMDVTAVVAPGGSTNTFSFQNYQIGSSLVLTTLAPIGNTVATLLSFDSGFFPVGPFGSLLVDPLTSEIYGIDLSIGIVLKNIPIPNDPNLIGCSPHFQVVSANLLDPLASELYNPACFTIR